MTIDNLRYLKYYIYNIIILKAGLTMYGEVVAAWEWFCCPNCGWKLCKVSSDLVLRGGVIVWCKKCKSEVEVKRTA